MISQAFQHCHGLGPVKLRQLAERGVTSWHDVVGDPDCIPAGLRSAVVAECQRSLQALQDDDIGWFVDRFSPGDKWRILSQYHDRTTFFDIETTGLELDATITVIVCWHRGRLHTFVEHENLDDFLSLLDDVELLASFNGTSFDVPRVLDGFHIPSLPCPHLDLRWLSHHQGLKGGLKRITSRLGFPRPADLHETDGEMAVRLWWDWRQRQDQAARDHLIRYCAADVLMLVLLSQHLARRQDVSADDLWAHLPASPATPVATQSTDRRARFVQSMFGGASPATLRTRRRRRR
ncbi:MAG: ribonuclease H-like domain-containing protein [Planctomycetaceae bacterium]